MKLTIPLWSPETRSGELLSKYNSVKGTTLKETSFSACIKMKETDKTIIMKTVSFLNVKHKLLLMLSYSLKGKNVHFIGFFTKNKLEYNVNFCAILFYHSNVIKLTFGHKLIALDKISTCCFNCKIGVKKGHDASQKVMAPLLCPVMYKFLKFENPVKLAALKLIPSLRFVSMGISGG